MLFVISMIETWNSFRNIQQRESRSHYVDVTEIQLVMARCVLDMIDPRVTVDDNGEPGSFVA